MNSKSILLGLIYGAINMFIYFSVISFGKTWINFHLFFYKIIRNTDEIVMLYFIIILTESVLIALLDNHLQRKYKWILYLFLLILTIPIINLKGIWTEYTDTDNYTYDYNGNLKTDKHKEIIGIEYNYLPAPPFVG